VSNLCFLASTIYEKYDLVFASSIEPDTKDLATMRNYIEHKSFKTVEFGKLSIVDNGLTYLISREDFELKTLRLFELVRAALFFFR
jgi:LA2681-like HEPN